MVIRPSRVADKNWVVSVLEDRWGTSVIVAKDRVCDAAEIEALIAEDASGSPIGLLTYRIGDGGLEVVTLDSMHPGHGVATGLLARATEIAYGVGAARLWLITTNDNLDALGCYQRRGLRVVAVHKGAVDRARLLKPSIPVVAHNGIELHDEIELELELAPTATR